MKKEIEHMVDLAQFQNDLMTIASISEGLTICWGLCSFVCVYPLVQCCA